MKVTFLIPTYNRKKYLLELLARLESIENKNSGKVEVVIVDNASNDGSISAVRLLGNKTWLKIHENEVNLGASENLFAGISKCTGDFIWWMGDDDYVEESVVREVLEKIKTYNDLGTVLLNRKLIQAPNDNLAEYNFIPNNRNLLFKSLNILLKQIGPMSLFGSISAFLFKNEKRQIIQIYKPFVDLMTSYPHVGVILALFNDKPSLYIGSASVVCRIDNHRLDTFDYSSFMTRTPHYGLSIGYSRLLKLLSEEYNLPLINLINSKEYSPFQEKELTVSEFILHHLNSAASVGDIPNMIEFKEVQNIVSNIKNRNAIKTANKINNILSKTMKNFSKIK